MTDSLDRLYRKVLLAREADPHASRTARLFRRGRPHMAKKLGEEAVEVVIDAIAGDSEAVVRESADLIYHMAVLWAACGIRPAEIWAEMDRRERLLGIAEKMPKANKSRTAKSAGKRDAAIPPLVAKALVAKTLGAKTLGNKTSASKVAPRRAVAAHRPASLRKQRLRSFKRD